MKYQQIRYEQQALKKIQRKMISEDFDPCNEIIFQPRYEFIHNNSICKEKKERKGHY